MLDSQIDPSVGAGSAVVTLTASTATRLTTAKSGGERGIVLTADPANTSDIFVGVSNTVTNVVGWFTWFRPESGPLIIPVGDPSGLFLYTTGTGQKFGWAAL